MDPLAEYEAVMQAQLESEAALKGAKGEHDVEMIDMFGAGMAAGGQGISDSMEADMAALAEAEAFAEKKQLNVNAGNPTDQVLLCENGTQRGVSKTLATKNTLGSASLLPTLRVRMKENTDPLSDRTSVISPALLSLSDSDPDDLLDSGRTFSEDNRCLSTIPVSGDYIPITLSSGERYFARMESDSNRKCGKKAERSIKDFIAEDTLGPSVTELLREIEKEERQEIRRITADMTMKDSKNVRIEEIPESIGAKGVGHKKGKRSSQKSVEPKRNLWVEKYRPRRFTDLLSNDKINREVLHWLKLWDPVVFPETKRRLGPGESNSGLSKLMNSPARKRSPAARGRRDAKPSHPENWNSVDSSRTKYPEHKIILISGPPGLGKTTLAHIVARHAGYRVVEINASDDRTKKTLVEKVQAATQMQSVFGADARPNCLVIDEIDGVCGGAESRGTIDALVQLAQVKSKSTNESMNIKKKSKKSLPVLSRPIICICNDPYMPELRPLRKVALQFTFERPKTFGKLVGRLKHICRIERLHTDAKALQLMCQSLNGDIRACLNALQFVKNKTGGQLTVDSIAHTALGEKDMNRDRFDVWKSLFYRQPPRREHTRGEGFLENRKGSKTSRVVHEKTRTIVQLFNSISSHGSNEKILEGAHFNYLNQPYMDVNLQQTSEAAEWYAIADQLASHSIRSNGFAGAGAGRFVPYAAAAIHHICANTRPAYILFPRAEGTLKQTLKSNQNIARSFLSHKNKFAKDGISANSVILETLSPLLEVVTNPHPGFGSGRLTEVQQQQKANLIDTYVAMGLTFTPSAGLEKSSVDDSTQSFRYKHMQRLELDPPINRLTIFGSSFPEICVPPRPKWQQQGQNEKYEVVGTRYIAHKFKENVRRDVEFEHVRRNVSRQREHSKGNNVDSMAKANFSSNPTAQVASKIDSLVNAKNALVGQRKGKNESGGQRKTKTCFLAVARRKNRTKRKCSRSSSQKITYTFQEGFTNAVRRPVLVRDFFLAI